MNGSVELLPGSMVNDKVRLEEPLGEGSMGVVWVAEHLTLETRVAVKFLSEDVAGDEKALARFEREARASAQVRSPHVAQTFDHGVTPDGRPYLVMELLEGQSLVERLGSGGAMPAEDCARLVEHIAQALTAAHERGIVHRDVKPGNIFLLDQGNSFFCKLLDFGIAKQTRAASIAGLTEAGVMIGTPEYMSPEQLMSPSEVDKAADLWGLAASAYSALTDEVPFDGESMGALCVKVLNAEYTPPSAQRAELPETIDAWFARAFHRQPEARFRSAEELSATFARAVAGEAFDENREPVAALAPDPERDERRKAAVEAAHRADVATFSGSASDAQRTPPKRPWIAAIALSLAILGVAVIIALRSSTPVDAPAPTVATQADVASSTANVAPETSAPVVAPSVTVRPSATVAPKPSPIRRPMPGAPLPKKKRRGAAPNTPGF